MIKVFSNVVLKFVIKAIKHFWLDDGLIKLELKIQDET